MTSSVLASAFTRRLWTLIIAKRFLESSEVSYLPGWVTSTELETWDFPLEYNDHLPAIVSAAGFQRFAQTSELVDHYEEEPGTRVYESIEINAPSWYSLLCVQLALLSNARVVATLYESVTGDVGLDRHVDRWHGVIIQLEGEKLWSLGDQGESQILMRRGDVLLLPEGTRHLVSTPEKSLHMVIAIIQAEPIGLKAIPISS